MNRLLTQSLTLPGGGTIQGPDGVTTAYGGSVTIGGILSRALPLVFIFAGVGLLLMLLSGGFTFLTSAGDSKKLEQGKQKLTNALLGFLIIFASFWLVQAAGVIFNFTPAQTIFQ